MALIMPPIKQLVSPNYSPTLIAHDLVIIHDEEGENAGSIAWLCDPRAQAAPHLAMNDDGSLWYQFVPLQFKAWAEVSFNGRGVSIEMPGFVGKIPDARLRAVAIGIAWLCHVYAIPVQWAKGGAGRGICSHHDLGAAGGGHVDIGPVGGTDFMNLLGYVKAEYDAMSAGPLPLWALHGAPGPHEIVAPPDITPAPSHNGVPRNEPGDTHAHPTPSTFAKHSIAALQSDLNEIMQSKLTVDGWLGSATRGVLTLFQGAHGCKTDGQIGPESWAAVDRAMAA